MVESIARAERSDQQLSPSSYFVWQVPQKPVVVRISLAVVDRLERDAVESFRSLTSRGSEIGGLLFGDVVPGTPAVVTIEDYGAVPCDYTRGPLYRLSEADIARFERSIEQRGSSGPSVVGFFRSHTRKGLSLDAEDAAFFQARFRDPHQIVLLVRPAATKASVGGIFIWEGGTVNTESSYLEFPFRSAELQLLRAAAEAESQPPAALPAPKPPTRAQIVPIASRRDPAPPAPEVAPPRPPEPAPAQPPKQADPQPAPPAAAKPVPAPEAVPELKPPAIETRVPVAPAEAPEILPEPRGGKWVWVIGAAVLLAILVTIFIYRGLAPHSRPAPAASAQQDTSPLSLRVERTAGGLLLTWNRASQAIEGARRAVLSISDGERHENFDMDIEQLRKGSIVYMPYTQDVSFRMEVTGDGKLKAASEMVRVLRSSPMPEVPDKDKPANADAVGPKVDPAAGADPEKPKWAQPVKPFSTASLASRLRPARPTEIPEAPALGGGDESAPSAALPVNLGTVVPAPPAPSAPAPLPPAPAPAKVAPAAPATSKLQSAQLVSRRDPVYPELASKNNIKGTVHLLATVGTNGRVKAVKVLNGHPLLAQSAIDAVMQWVYRPTMLNGVSQESQVDIVLNFMGNR
jgi:protein TonB